MVKWKKGRQHGVDYFKLQLYKFKIKKLGFDCYILKYLPETILPPHKDKIDGKHYRLNLTLWGSSYFLCEKEIIRLPFLHLFRPDKYIHSLKINTKTYKLSLGFAKLN